MGEPTGIVEASFVRKDFYLDPPGKGASPAEWEAWLKADKLAAAAAKREHTKTLKHGEIPDHLAPKVLAKVNGVYRQSALVGLVGDGDATRIEAAVDADQDTRVHLSPWARVGGRGATTKGRAGSSKRAKAKALRKARKGQN